MKLLILGGTGFIGQHVTRRASDEGHAVTVFHRGQTRAALPSTVRFICGDRQRLDDFTEAFTRLAPDVVIDTNPYTEPQAASVMRVFRRIAQRLVALSSGDVYRAYDRFRRIVVEPPDPHPLREDSPLREHLYPYRAPASGPEDGVFHYEKILVERTVLGDRHGAGTVLRLPMVYGPGDHQHRLFPYLKRMDDGRPAIALEITQAQWRCTRGYVENVAAAIVRAAAAERAAGHVYNVGEPEALSEAEWVARIGQMVGWSGTVAPLPPELLPASLTLPVDWQHHLVMNTNLLREQLGFTEPIPPAEGLRRTVEWERAHPPGDLKPEQFDYAAEEAALAALRRQADPS